MFPFTCALRACKVQYACVYELMHNTSNKELYRNKRQLLLTYSLPVLNYIIKKSTSVPCYPQFRVHTLFQKENAA